MISHILEEYGTYVGTSRSAHFNRMSFPSKLVYWCTLMHIHNLSLLSSSCCFETHRFLAWFSKHNSYELVFFLILSTDVRAQYHCIHITRQSAAGYCSNDHAHVWSVGKCGYSTAGEWSCELMQTSLFFQISPTWNSLAVDYLSHRQNHLPLAALRFGYYGLEIAENANIIKKLLNCTTRARIRVAVLAKDRMSYQTIDNSQRVVRGWENIQLLDYVR